MFSAQTMARDVEVSFLQYLEAQLHLNYKQLHLNYKLYLGFFWAFSETAKA